MTIVHPGEPRCESRSASGRHQRRPQADETDLELQGCKSPSWKHDLAANRAQLASDVNFEITDQLGQCRISQAKLAELIGVSPGRVSQILSGGENLTIGSLATIATALGGHFDVTFVPGRDRHAA